MPYPSFFYPGPKHAVSARTCEWWELDGTVGGRKVAGKKLLILRKSCSVGGSQQRTMSWSDQEVWVRN